MKKLGSFRLGKVSRSCENPVIAEDYIMDSESQG